MTKKETRFLYIGPDIGPPYYGEVFNARYVGNTLEKGIIPLKHFVELNEEQLDKIEGFYEKFNEEFHKLSFEESSNTKVTKELTKKVGLHQFVNEIAKEMGA